MSTKKNKTVASEALLEMDSITQALKEETQNTLNSLLTEAVKNALRESVEDKDEDEEDFEIVDDEEKETSNDNENNEPKETEVEDTEEEKSEEEITPEESDTEETQESSEEEDEDEGWDEFSGYQTGDGNTYDLTGENDYDKVVKVYKLLSDDDQVVIKKEDGKIQLKDNEANTEYVIDLGEEENDGEEESLEELNEVASEEEPSFEEIIVDDDMAGFPDEIEISDEEDSFEDDNFNLNENKSVKNNKKQRKPMKESKDVIFEVDLGYTDNYQDVDPIEGLSNDEPSNTGKSWHKGVPTGTQKPWAGDAETKGDPFKEEVNEEIDDVEIDDAVEEGTNVGGAVQQRSMSKSKIPTGRKENGPFTKHNTSTGSEFNAEINESIKKIKKENSELKKAIVELRKNLNEAYITNVNLGKITKLFLENATSQTEKVEIVNRFTNEAKTIEQSNALYESLNKQLKKKEQQVNIDNSPATVNGTQNITENKVYKSDDLLKTIDLMGRVLNC